MKASGHAHLLAEWLNQLGTARTKLIAERYLILAKSELSALLQAVEEESKK